MQPAHPRGRVATLDTGMKGLKGPLRPPRERAHRTRAAGAAGAGQRTGLDSSGGDHRDGRQEGLRGATRLTIKQLRAPTERTDAMQSTAVDGTQTSDLN